MTNYDQTDDLIDTAATIEQTGAADLKAHPTSGMQRPDAESTQYDPDSFGRVLDGDRGGDTMPITPGQRSPRPLIEHRRPYVHSGPVSAAHNRVGELHRRPAHHEIATPKKVAAAWDKVIEAIEAANVAIRAIPQGVAEAEAERATRLDQATEAVVLPSSADVRAYLETVAIKACRAAEEERRRYDGLVTELTDEHLAALEKQVPAEAAKIRERVADLTTAIERLRQRVAAIVEVAGSKDKSTMPASMPGQADLAALEAIEQELAALEQVTQQPTQPRISPTLRQRQAIANHARQVPGGLTAEVIDLARIEEAEAYRYTSHTRGIPRGVLENARVAATR